MIKCSCWHVARGEDFSQFLKLIVTIWWHLQIGWSDLRNPHLWPVKNYISNLHQGHISGHKSWKSNTEKSSTSVIFIMDLTFLSFWGSYFRLLYRSSKKPCQDTGLQSCRSCRSGVSGGDVLGVGGVKPSQTFSHWQDHQPKISKVSQIWSNMKMFFETTNQILLIFNMFNEIGSCWGILVGCFRAHMIF